MSSRWPTVPLGDVISHRKQFEIIDDRRVYRRCRVRLHAKGVVLRDEVPGLEIRTKKQQVCRTGEFLVAEIDAKLGGYGIVPESLEGSIVSSHYFLFGINTEKLCRKFLDYFLRTPGFADQVAAQGSTNYAAVRPGHVLAYRIPLPPISEQRRIVARIEALAEKIVEARRLNGETADETALFLARGMEYARNAILTSEASATELGSLARVTSGGTPPRDNAAYWGGDIPWAKTGELLDGDLDRTGEQITNAGLANSSAKLFPPETVLIALYGQGQTRGRTARLLIPAATNQACAAILPCERILPRYLQFWLRSLYREMREENHGGAQPNWSGEMIKAIRIAVPTLAKQRQTIRYVDALGATVRALDKLHESRHRGTQCPNAINPRSGLP